MAIPAINAMNRRDSLFNAWLLKLIFPLIAMINDKLKNNAKLIIAVLDTVNVTAQKRLTDTKINGKSKSFLCFEYE